eukprot:TRINITY_DN636_c0_g2_i3.p1 TRINITY_DN636_c0_g2~~TRINITY_DN636_c0_g2_i3.p1  ORF type:complete len:299 (-),score=44.25 TRINITY_DN636_c0_g2_i3:539-1435(-)
MASGLRRSTRVRRPPQRFQDEHFESASASALSSSSSSSSSRSQRNDDTGVRLGRLGRKRNIPLATTNTPRNQKMKREKKRSVAKSRTTSRSRTTRASTSTSSSSKEKSEPSFSTDTTPIEDTSRAVEPSVVMNSKELVMNLRKKNYNFVFESHVSLLDYHLSAEEAAAVAEAIRRSSELNSVFVQRCELDDECTKLIVEALSHQAKLQKLWILGPSRVGDEGIRAFVDCIKSTRLICVYIEGGVMISKETITALQDALRYSATLDSFAVTIGEAHFYFREILGRPPLFSKLKQSQREL